MALARGIGAVLRGAGKALDEMGIALQGKLGVRETRESTQIKSDWSLFSIKSQGLMGGGLISHLSNFQILLQ